MQKIPKLSYWNLKIIHDEGSPNEDLDRICHAFNEKLYIHKGILEETLEEILEGFPLTFIDGMNALLTKEITPKELYGATDSMVNAKSLGHDRILI